MYAMCVFTVHVHRTCCREHNSTSRASAVVDAVIAVVVVAAITAVIIIIAVVAIAIAIVVDGISKW